jgi:hypothetical protein
MTPKRRERREEERREKREEKRDERGERAADDDVVNSFIVVGTETKKYLNAPVSRQHRQPKMYCGCERRVRQMYGLIHCIVDP